MDKFLAEIGLRFGLIGTARPLGGEYDLNFLTQDATGLLIVKIMRPDCDLNYVGMQIDAICHALERDPSLPLPETITPPFRLMDECGVERIVWLQRALGGRPMGDMPPQAPALLSGLGHLAGRLNQALRDFEHPQLERANKWQLLDAGWIENDLDRIKSSSRHALLRTILAEYWQILPNVRALRSQAIHNDLNDWNILIRKEVNRPSCISGLVDFGDMSRAPVICDLAIAGAYAIMRQKNKEQALAALVTGFHASCPLSADELGFLWVLIKMRLAVSVVNAAIESEKTPGELYVTISERTAWQILEDKNLNETRLLARLRHVCGLPVTASAPAIIRWIDAHRDQFHPVLNDDLRQYPIADLSAVKCLWPENPLLPHPLKTLEDAGLQAGGKKALGRYGEPRLGQICLSCYPVSPSAPERSAISLGLDVFAPDGMCVHAPLAGEIIHIVRQPHGMQMCLRHETEAGIFFTYWAHLVPCDRTGYIGSFIAAGQAFATIAPSLQNEGGVAHFFMQMSFAELSFTPDTSFDEQEFACALFPNPAALFDLDAAALSFIPCDQADLLDYRQSHFSANLKLSYRRPVMFVRGWKHYLFDQWGRPFLDAYNNVPHVGHAHPRIRQVACRQLARMNGNTRYLHPAQRDFAEKLIAKMPAGSGLDVCFFVNSGSEANELALRLVRAATGGHDMITADHGYHGNTTGALDISAYKFSRPGMSGRRPWVQLVDIADGYRGRYRAEDPNCVTGYTAQIDEAIVKIRERGGKLAGFICETFPSVGGQIIPPSGYLKGVYQRIRAAGGLCIADEVQTGLGRLGGYYFAFEQQGVVPDIVVLGKPLGNGHPLAALVTTREIAGAFAKGAEYFSTFGGSTLSCLIGREVLDIVDDECLADNAALMGERLLSGLRQLQIRHHAIGDVRGLGLFIGVDMVEERDSRKPATALAEHLVNYLREAHILIGCEGPDNNVLKIRPPLTIDALAIDRICVTLDEALNEIS